MFLSNHRPALKSSRFCFVLPSGSDAQLAPRHSMKRLLLKRSIITRTNIAFSLRTRQRSSLCEISNSDLWIVGFLEMEVDFSCFLRLRGQILAGSKAKFSK